MLQREEKSMSVVDVLPPHRANAEITRFWGRRTLLCPGSWMFGAFLIWSISTPLPAQAAPLQLAPVYIGGVTPEMRNLAIPTTTAAFRANGGAFYAHETYLLDNTSGNCPQQTASPALAATIKNFASSAPAMAEIGMMTPLAITQLMACNYHAVGLQPQVALVNVVYEVTTLTDFKALVDAGRKAGLLKIGPLASSNTSDQPEDWNNPYYDTLKQMALYGGVVGMDTPAALYKLRGPGYIRFSQQVEAWARSSGVTCVDIVSPEDGETAFTQDAVAWARAIATPPGNLPDAFVVENYNYTTTPDIGTEATSGSLAYTALEGLYALGR